ncbi:DUF5677 domain-containing protein [Formosa agariphila]|nr:DUF5677 domain-containing protein [Formosa agariphila]
MEEKGLNITSCINNYVENVRSSLKIRWNKWDKNLIEHSTYEVIGGILARQCSLAIQLSTNLQMWNEEIAPIILRTMADNHINLAWILVNPKEHSEKFIIHGLGQLKLDLEHRKNNLDETMKGEIEEYIEREEQFINSQKYTFLTEVNLGSWSGLNTRKMAEEAGIIDFYNYVYQPFSNCTHSTWAHISKYNTDLSKNPLHKFFRHPIIIDFEPHINYLNLAGKYLDKSMREFDRVFKLNINEDSAFDILLKELNELSSEKNN